MKICDKESLKKVLSNAIPLLCQSGLPKQTSFRIDAMIGITIDTNQSSTLICFSESIGPNNQPNIMSLIHNNTDTLNNNHYDNVDYNNTYNEGDNPVIDTCIPVEDNDDDDDDDNTFNDNFQDTNNIVANDDKIELTNNIDHTNIVVIANNNTNLQPTSNSNNTNIQPNNNNIDILPNSNNSNNIDTKQKKRPRKSKPYSNTQLSSLDQQQDNNNITIKQEIDDDFIPTSYPPDNNNSYGDDNKYNNNNFGEENNNFGDDNKNYVEEKNTIEWSINETNNSNNTTQITTNLPNNNIDQYPNNNTDLYQNTTTDQYPNNTDQYQNNNIDDQGWMDDNNNNSTNKKWKWNAKKQRPNKKYPDSLPLEASSYLEQQQLQHLSSTTAATIATSDLINNLANTPTPNNDTDYNNLMQGICDFVMSQSQRINDKTRPQSRTCHICQATLSNPLSLKNHIQGTHLALKLRRCNMCGETFKWTMQLARHKKRVHGGGEFVNIYNVT